MSVSTQVLPRATLQEPDDGPRVSGRFAVDLDRCAAEVVVRMFGLNLWRARLRVLAAELDVLPTGVLLSARAAVKPRFVSVPLTQGRFLPKTPRDERITLVTTEFPAPAAPCTVKVDAVASDGQHFWELPLAVRFVDLDQERILLAITGVIPQRSDGVVPITPLRIDVAAEFVRWP